MTAPPIQQSPQFDVPGPIAPRRYGGWFILIVLFTLMIGQSLALYLKRDTAKESKHTAEAQSLRYSVEMKQAFLYLNFPSSGEFDKSLVTIVDELGSKAKSDLVAARLLAATQSELKQEVSPEAIKNLENSKDPQDKLLARTFSAKELSKDEGQALVKDLQGKSFVSRLAEVHAMEKSGQGFKAREELVPKSRAIAKMVAILGIVVAVFLGLALLVGYWIFKASGKIPSVGLPLAKISVADADRLAMRCAQLFALFLGIQILASFLGMGIDENWLTLGIYIAFVATSIAIFGFPVGGKQFSIRDIGIHSKDLGKNIAWGVGTAIANLPIVFLMAIIGTKLFAALPPAEHPITVQLQSGVNWFGLGVIFFSASIGAPILEEIMFRGTLLPALARVWGRPVLAILMQGLIFAAIHPTGVPAWLPLATIGAMSGFLSRQTGSLVSSIVMHGVHNFGTLLFALAFLG